MPISNETAPVRGIANSGPMMRYRMMSSTVANIGHVFVRRSGTYSPPASAIAVMPSSGSPMPVVMKPSIASSV